MSIFSSLFSAISRLFADAPAHNTLVIRTVEIFFHRSPSPAQDVVRGIDDISWRVMSGGVEIQNGLTNSDGLVAVQVRGTTDSILELLHDGTVVSQYRVRPRAGGYEADTTVEGVQRRLMQLGYHIGHSSPTGDGVDGDLGTTTDKAILDFQIDEVIDFDGVVGGTTRSHLNDQCGGSAQP